MLDPQDRLRYLDQLRPPMGYAFDAAVGTTFSLDLLSLLIMPLSLVLFECEDKEEALSDPTAIIEALRRTSDKIAIFCQQGQIAVPSPHNVLFSYLEPMVVQVSPGDPEGVFHPKVWLIRYRGEDKSLLYRFLCLSRNMTFDRSWDTVLTLEGSYDQQRQLAYSVNRPLSDFISSLPEMGQRVSPAIRRMVDKMADEVLRVKFKEPDPFESIQFWPLGIPGYMRGPQFDSHSRLLIMSPFLSSEKLRPLIERGRNNVLISRTESLDAEWETLRATDNLQLYVMEQGAEYSQASDADGAPEPYFPAEDDPSGLHTKLYILEEGWNARVFTGSANATNNGLGGLDRRHEVKNVEFLTELVGKKSRVGIDQVLSGSNGTSLRSLLTTYKVPEEAPVVDQIGKKLDQLLRASRRALAQSNLWGEVVINEEGKYSIVLRAKEKIMLSDVQCGCWPAVLPPSYEKNIGPIAKQGEIAFNGLSILSLTSFFAFRVTAEMEGKERTALFALNLPVKGMPEDRGESILRHLINNTDRFVRYILLLLSDNPERLAMGSLGYRNGQNGHNGNGSGSITAVPLLEELVRAFSRNPAKLATVERLIRDLTNGEKGNNGTLPAGFDEVWEAFRLATTQGGEA